MRREHVKKRSGARRLFLPVVILCLLCGQALAVELPGELRSADPEAAARMEALHRIKHSALCGARQGFCPLTPPPLKRWTKLFNQGQIKERSPSTGVGPAGRGR